MHTVSDVISDLQATFPQASAAELFEVVQQVHAELCDEFPVQSGIRTILAVAETHEYPLPREVTSVRSCLWVDGPASFQARNLDAVSVPDLDRLRPNWRVEATAPQRTNPRAFYLDAGNIGLDVAPKASASGGYPAIRLAVTLHTPLEMGGPLPDSIRTRAIYVQGARRYYAEIAQPDRVQLYAALYESAIQGLERRLGARNRAYRRISYPSSHGMMRQV